MEFVENCVVIIEHFHYTYVSIRHYSNTLIVVPDKAIAILETTRSLTQSDLYSDNAHIDNLASENWNGSLVEVNGMRFNYCWKL